MKPDPKTTTGDASGTAAQTSNAAINATIKLIRTTGKKLNEAIQLGIVQCVVHANDFGDCTGAARLVDAIPQTARRNEVINHFGDYSPIRIVKDTKTGLMKASLRKPEDANYNAFNIEGVKANPWFDRKSISEREPGMPFDLGEADKKVIQLAELIERKAAGTNKTIHKPEGDVEEIVVKDTHREKLRELASKLKAIAREYKDVELELALASGDEPGQQAENGEDVTVRTGTDG